MSTFFLHNSEIYGFMFDPNLMALNPQNVITFLPAGTFNTLRLTGVPTGPAGLPSGSVWNNGGVLCIV